MDLLASNEVDLKHSNENPLEVEDTANEMLFDPIGQTIVEPSHASGNDLHTRSFRLKKKFIGTL